MSPLAEAYETGRVRLARARAEATALRRVDIQASDQTKALEFFTAVGQRLLQRAPFTGVTLDEAVRVACRELDARHEAKQALSSGSTPAIPPPPGPESYLDEHLELPLFSSVFDEPPTVMAVHRQRWIAEQAHAQLVLNDRVALIKRCEVQVLSASFVVWAVLDMGSALSEDETTSPSAGAPPSCSADGSPTRAARGKKPRHLGVPLGSKASGTGTAAFEVGAALEPGFESQDPRRATDARPEPEVTSCPSDEAGPPRANSGAGFGKGAGPLQMGPAHPVDSRLRVLQAGWAAGRTHRIHELDYEEGCHACSVEYNNRCLLTDEQLVGRTGSVGDLCPLLGGEVTLRLLREDKPMCGVRRVSAVGELICHSSLTGEGVCEHGCGQ